MITVDNLIRHCTKIHYFGLGFIQIKLSDSQRVHIYTQKLPAIVGDEEVHDHRYNFTSEIIRGSFRQDIYEMVEGTTHIMEYESCTADVEAPKESTLCGLQKILTMNLVVGSIYSVDHSVFHTVASDNAITLLTREGYSKEFARVISPIDLPAVCPFSQSIQEEDMWEIVREVVGD